MVVPLALLMATFARASDGDLDPSFGLAGVAYAGIADASSYSGMTMQPDGKVLACGTHATGNDHDFVVVRFLADGSPDTAFGTNGRVSIAFDHSPYSGYDQCYSLAMQPDGKIVAAGSTKWNIGPAIIGLFAVARLTVDGTLDPSFGEGGTATAVGTPALISVAEAGSVALQTDGRIVVGGQLMATEEGPLYRFALARFTANGMLDPSFNGTGWTEIPAISFPYSDAMAAGVALDAQARIVIAGSNPHDAESNANSDFAVARVLPNGTLDASFGQAGRALVAFDAGGSGSGSDIAYGLAIDHAGRTVVVGMADTSSATTPNYDVAVARLLDDGSPDVAFGDAGKVRVAFDSVPSGMDFARAVVVQADGKLVLAGAAQGASSSRAPILARLADDGSLDPDFGNGGRKILHIGTDPEIGTINRAALAGGRLFVSGVEKTAASASDYFVARVSITLEDGIFANGFE